ncbi:MAG: hypothetical protein WC627_12645 [Legionella sp.]|jgi:hypothetical protein
MKMFDMVTTIVKQYGDITMLTDDNKLFKVKVTYPLSSQQLNDVEAIFDKFKENCTSPDHIGTIGASNMICSLTLEKNDADRLYNQLSAVLKTISDQMTDDIFYSMV